MSFKSFKSARADKDCYRIAVAMATRACKNCDQQGVDQLMNSA
jgi:hypothetical protein